MKGAPIFVFKGLIFIYLDRINGLINFEKNQNQKEMRKLLVFGGIIFFIFLVALINEGAEEKHKLDKLYKEVYKNDTQPDPNRTVREYDWNEDKYYYTDDPPRSQPYSANLPDAHGPSEEDLREQWEEEYGEVDWEALEKYQRQVMKAFKEMGEKAPKIDIDDIIPREVQDPFSYQPRYLDDAGMKGAKLKLDRYLGPYFRDFLLEYSNHNNGKKIVLGDKPTTIRLVQGLRHSKGKFGVCYNNSKERIIHIDYQLYQEEPLETLITFYHECGHCYLEKGHDNRVDANGSPLSMMHEYFLDWAHLFTDNEVYYLKQLFNY